MDEYDYGLRAQYTREELAEAAREFLRRQRAAHAAHMERLSVEDHEPAPVSGGANGPKSAWDAGLLDASGGPDTPSAEWLRPT